MAGALAKMRTMESLQLNDSIDDILITLQKQYHLIRLLNSPDGRIEKVLQV